MRAIKHCLNPKLTQLYERSVQLEELSHKVKQIIPSDWAPKCHVSSFNKGCLILTTEDSVWASQLRYFLPELRDKLRTEAKMYELSSIKILVVASEEPYKQPKRLKTNPISEKSRTLIFNESQNCTYEPLQKALLALAQKNK